MPFSPFYFLFLVSLVAVLFAFVQLGLLSITFEKLGLPPSTGLSFLFFSLLGSLINLPLTRIQAEPGQDPVPTHWVWQGALRNSRAFSGTTLIAVNVGGCILPLLLSAYLAIVHAVPLVLLLLATFLTSLLAYAVSRPVPGLGIGMPMLVAPLAAAMIASLLSPELRAPLAYISGTLGVLIGADLLHLKDIPKLATPVASIGGAGTFDGIFLTGLIAALLT